MLQQYNIITEATRSRSYIDETIASTIAKTNMNSLRLVNNNGDKFTMALNDTNIIECKNQDANNSDTDISIAFDKLKILSDVNSTSPTTGSVIAYGGVGILKDLYIGGGAYFQNDGGAPSKLDYFEEGSLEFVWEGIWGDVISSTVLYQRIGKMVVLMFPLIIGTLTTSGIITNSVDSCLPERLLPIYDIKNKIICIDNSSNTDGYVKIYGASGNIHIETSQGNFSEGMSGFETFSVTYICGTRW